MKTSDEILERIDQLSNDSRHKAKPKMLQLNAPLSLIQMAIKSEIHALKWVIDNPNCRDMED